MRIVTGLLIGAIIGAPIGTAIYQRTARYTPSGCALVIDQYYATADNTGIIHGNCDDHAESFDSHGKWLGSADAKRLETTGSFSVFIGPHAGNLPKDP